MPRTRPLQLNVELSRYKLRGRLRAMAARAGAFSLNKSDSRAETNTTTFVTSMNAFRFSFRPVSPMKFLCTRI